MAYRHRCHLPQKVANPPKSVSASTNCPACGAHLLILASTKPLLGKPGKPDLSLFGSADLGLFGFVPPILPLVLPLMGRMFSQGHHQLIRRDPKSPSLHSFNDFINGNSVKALTSKSLTTQVLPRIPAKAHHWIPVTLMKAHQSSPDLGHHQSDEHQNSFLEQVWMKMETLLDNTPWIPVICRGVIWIPLICRGVIWILTILMRTCQRNTQSLGVLLEPVIWSRGYCGADQQC